MPILESTKKFNYQALPFKPNEQLSVILHLAAQIDELPFHLPFPLSESIEKKRFIENLKKLSTQLSALYNSDITIRIFKLKLLPPGRINDIFKSVKRPFVEAKYDVAIMIICNNEEVANQIQQNSYYKEIHEIFMQKPAHDMVVAKNIRKAGESHVHDAFKQGVYLFNYFYVENTEFDFLPVWEHTSRWFVEYTNLDNSYLMKPIAGDTNFQYINHCYWHRLSEFVPKMIFSKSLKSYVLDNFSYNRAIAFPIIYTVV